MCGPPREDPMAGRPIDNHVVKAMRCLKEIWDAESGENLTNEQVVEEFALVVQTEKKSLVEKFTRYMNDECIECGKKMPEMPPDTMCNCHEVICPECEQLG